MKFHERVRAVIGDISAADVARILGRAPGTVRQWMTGERRWEGEELSRLLDELHVSPERRGAILSHDFSLVPDGLDDTSGTDGPSRTITDDNDDPTEETQDPPEHCLPAMRAAGWEPRTPRGGRAA